MKSLLLMAAAVGAVAAACAIPVSAAKAPLAPPASVVQSFGQHHEIDTRAAFPRRCGTERS